MRLTETSDRDLVSQTARGSADAYAELWRRHAGAARAAARSVTRIDPDDLVSETYTRVLALIKAGRGPTDGFRPYVLVTTRNIAAEWGGRSREHPTDFPDDIEGPDLTMDAVVAEHERSTVARAFRALPERSREVLWYTAVEGMSVSEVAPIMGLKPNAVAALSFRAREALRTSWVGMQIDSITGHPECEWTSRRIPRRARGSLRPAEAARVDRHLDECDDCRAVAAEAMVVDERLRIVLVPLLLGTAAAGYLEWIGQQRAPAASASAVSDGGGSAAVVTADRVSPRPLLVGGAVAVAAALALGAWGFAAGQPATQAGTAQPGASDAVTAAGSSPTQDASATDDALATEEAPVVIPSSPAPPVSIPRSVPAPVPPPATSVPVPIPPMPLTPAPPVVLPMAPSIEAKPTEPWLLPSISGIAEPGALVRVAATAQPSGQVSMWDVQASASGIWTTDAAVLPAGVYDIAAIQRIRSLDSAESATIVVTIEAPPALSVTMANPPKATGERKATFVVTGVPGRQIDFTLGGVTTVKTLDSSGTFTYTAELITPAAAADHSVRYRMGGLVGPSRTVAVVQ